MQQTNALALLGCQPIELEARFRQIEYPSGDVHPDDFCELMIREQAPQEFALAATKVEQYTGGPRREAFV